MTTNFGSTMKAKHIPSTLALTLAVSLPLAPALAVAESPHSEASALTHIYVETDTQALGGRGLGMQDAVIRETGATFDASGVKLIAKSQPNAAHLRIRFSGTAEDVRLYNYVLHFELIKGKTATQLIEPVACVKCFDQKLYDTLNAQVPALLEAIENEADDTKGNDVNPPPTGDGDGDVSDPPLPPPKPIGPMGISGAVGLVVGVGLSIGGAVVLADAQQDIVNSHQRFGVERDRTGLGVGLLVPGATLAVVGTVMLAVDVAKRAKQRKRSEPVTVVPTVSPFGAGIGIAGQF